MLAIDTLSVIEFQAVFHPPNVISSASVRNVWPCLLAVQWNCLVLSEEACFPFSATWNFPDWNTKLFPKGQIFSWKLSCYCTPSNVKTIKKKKKKKTDGWMLWAVIADFPVGEEENRFEGWSSDPLRFSGVSCLFDVVWRALGPIRFPYRSDPGREEADGPYLLTQPPPALNPIRVNESPRAVCRDKEFSPLPLRKEFKTRLISPSAPVSFGGPIFHSYSTES